MSKPIKLIIGAVAFIGTLYGLNSYFANPPTSLYTTNVSRAFLYPDKKDDEANKEQQKIMDGLNSKNEYRDLAVRFKDDSFRVYLKTDEGYKRAGKVKKSKLDELAKNHDDNIKKIKENYSGIRKKLREQ